jgi:hypothetical protein
MPTFVLRLIAPRPGFAQTITDAEREIMNRHAAHWRPYLERGDMVVFGRSSRTATRTAWRLSRPMTTGTAAFELGRMAAGHVRGR